MKNIFTLATSEIQDDVVATDADVFAKSEEAHNAAMAFMLSRVGDFLDIDESDCLARKRVLDQHMSIETSEFKGFSKTAYVYRCGSLCVSATVQECSGAGLAGFLVYDPDDGSWFYSMDPADGASPEGCGVWVNCRSRAKVMERDEAEAICSELKRRACDRRWALVVEEL
jgi:hypothetical protein